MSAPAPDAWATVRDARATLAPHARVERRDIRGEPWATLHNALNGEQVRVNGAALEVVLALDGERSLGEVLDRVVPDADDALREALTRAVLTLEGSGLVRLGRAVDTGRLLERAGARRPGRLDPLALRLPLHDPDAWLSRLAPLVRRVRGRAVLGACAALGALALAVAVARGEAIAAELARVAGTPARWWLYAALYPLLKGVHELAHALVVKRFGGAVHEAGLTILVLMPVPYVDASDSNRFAARGARLAVGAAGMLAEAGVAAAALLLWSATEPGTVHDVAFAAAVLGSVATLVFNANPLLRFDGYHLLQDALDMPNLGTRSGAYLAWLFRRHVLRADTPRPPVTGPRERRWLLGYGLASLAYRWVLTVSIAAWLIGAVPVAGVALALFAVHRLVLRPAGRGLRYLRGSTELAGRRTIASGTVAGLALALGAVVLFVPLPSSSRIEGVLRPAAQATLHAGADGEIVELAVPAGARVERGDTVLRLAAPDRLARRAVVEAEIELLATRRHALLDVDPVEAGRLARDLETARAEALALERELDALTVRAARAGRFAPSDGALVRGRTVARGEVLGHLVGDGALRVDAVVDQRAIGRVRDGVRDVGVRLAERPSRVHAGRLVSVTPSADRRLPSAALAFDGARGTPVASDAGELRTLEPVFHLEIGLPETLRAAGVGGRAWVTLAHEPEPLGLRGWRALRQLFLEQLSV